MKKAGHLLWAAVLMAGLLLLTACGNRQQEQEGTAYKIYYVNNEETKIVEREYVSGTTDGKASDGGAFGAADTHIRKNGL